MSDQITQGAERNPASAKMIASIGEEIRQLRHSKSLTIEALAERIARSVAHVSKLERGLTKPSLRDLYAISEALGVPVGWFLNERESAPAEELGLIGRSGSHRFYEQGGIMTEALSPILGGDVEMMRSVFQPGAATPKKRSAHRKREEGYLLSGKLELWIEDKHFVLQAGDSYSYMTDIVHHSRNPGPAPAVLIWVVTRVKGT